MKVLRGRDLNHVSLSRVEEEQGWLGRSDWPDEPEERTPPTVQPVTESEVRP